MPEILPQPKTIFKNPTMKNLLLLALIVPALFLSSCKKEEEAKPLSLVGEKFKDNGYEKLSPFYDSSLPNGFDMRNVAYYRVLEFVSDTQVNYYERYTPSTSQVNVMYISGISKLTYTIDDPNKQQPSIHITGALNGVSGKEGQGGKVDWTLIRTPRSFQGLPTLDMDNVHYTQQ
jgi:hypothetical protein